MKKDYTKYSFYIAVLVVAMLLSVSFIPPFTIGGVKFKRANIISELYEFDDRTEDTEIEISDEDKAFIKELERAEKELDEMAAQAEVKPAETQADSWEIGGDLADAGWGGATPSNDGELGAPLVRIEDYSEEGDISISDFCALLGTATQNRVVRLGFLGDSYIEGDIITADVRQQLQELYGGGGVGFISFESPLAANKPTVKHTFGNWQNYNLIYKSRAPENLQDKFYVSGIVSVPNEGAWSQYETVNFRRNLSRVSTARMIFTNTGSSTIHMVVNDTIERKFTPEPSELPQLINISGGSLKKIKINVENPEGFYGYGVVMESPRGIGVDNYSIRGNSGLALFGSNAAVNARINSALGYDLIVLQYGLNIMEAEVTGYSGYGKQLQKIINYMKKCFPRAAIVVMGVGDRSMQRDGEFVTMPAVSGMIAAQRAAAKECRVAFWSIYDVMAKFGGMSGFVEKEWAAKDYTHLSYGGGRRIASEFVKALEYVKRQGGSDVEVDDTYVAPQRVEELSTFETVDSTKQVELPDSVELIKIAEPNENADVELILEEDSIGTSKQPAEIGLPDSISVDSVKAKKADVDKEVKSHQEIIEPQDSSQLKETRQEDKTIEKDDSVKPRRRQVIIWNG